jgi:hypothetical protein
MMIQLADRYLVALIFLWSGLGKIRAWLVSRREENADARQVDVRREPIIHRTELGWHDPRLQVTVSSWEILLAVCLVAATGLPAQRIAGVFAMLTFAAFAISLLPVVRQKTTVRCGCFGGERSIPGSWAFGRAIVLMAAASGIWVAPIARTEPVINIEAAALAVAFICIVVVMANAALLFADTTRQLEEATRTTLLGTVSEE